MLFAFTSHEPFGQWPHGCSWRMTCAKNPELPLWSGCMDSWAVIPVEFELVCFETLRNSNIKKKHFRPPQCKETYKMQNPMKLKGNTGKLPIRINHCIYSLQVFLPRQVLRFPCCNLSSFSIACSCFNKRKCFKRVQEHIYADDFGDSKRWGKFHLFAFVCCHTRNVSHGPLLQSLLVWSQFF